MTGKMNWDRVRVEDLSLRHGSEWVPFSDSEHPLADLPFESKETEKSTKNKRHWMAVAPAPSMVGCSCGKPVGFKGQHKKRCSLCRVEAAITLNLENPQGKQNSQLVRGRSLCTGNGESDTTRKQTVRHKQGRSGRLILEVTNKGGVSVYGLGRFPVTLYYEQWARLLDAAQPLHNFLETNKTKLKLKQ